MRKITKAGTIVKTTQVADSATDQRVAANLAEINAVRQMRGKPAATATEIRANLTERAEIAIFWNAEHARTSIRTGRRG